jgi:GNAT superfamily N-acetyltransferase
MKARTPSRDARARIEHELSIEPFDASRCAPDDFSALLRAVPRQFDDASANCFVARLGHAIVGAMTIGPSVPQPQCKHYCRADVAILNRHIVDPSRREEGHGTAMLAYASRWSSSRGFLQLALDVPFVQNHLLDFYYRRGFRLVDVVESGVFGPERAILSRPTIAGWSALSVIH